MRKDKLIQTAVSNIKKLPEKTEKPVDDALKKIRKTTCKRCCQNSKKSLDHS